MANDSPQRFDLSNCDKEPIHIPGSIQPHGILLGLSEPLLQVEIASRSATEHLGRSSDEIIGRPLGELFDEDSFQLVMSTLSLPDPMTRRPLELQTKNGASYDGMVHRSGGLAVLELEPRSAIPERVIELPQLLTRVVAELRSAGTLSEICQLMAARMRELSGYDRCMVYRFDRYFNGEVVGEAKKASLPPYLGLHYPAADIPPQARRLYMENTLRLIVDVDYEPSPLEPSVNPHTGLPLDLSRGVLRSVSPFHREYLRNMGVRGTLSISLMLHGRLWGLCVLHHGEARHIRHELRATCEALGLFLSQRIGELEQSEAKRLFSEVHRTAQELRSYEKVFLGESPHASLSRVMTLLSCHAGALFVPNRPVTFGESVPHEALAEIVEKLADLEVDEFFETDFLESWLGPSPLTARFSGAVAVKLTGANAWLILLRHERITEVHWGSAKEKTIHLENGVPRLSPEGSFGLWKETVRGRSAPFEPHQLEALQTVTQGLRTLQAAWMNQENERTLEMKRAVDAKEEFIAQVSHELRNPLNAVQGWADLLASDESSLTPQVKRGLEVIQRNTRIQARLIDDLLDVSRIVRGSLRLELGPVRLEPILRAALESVESSVQAKRVRIQNIISPGTSPINADADRLQQMIWNLLSNAVKFTPKGGTVRITLRDEHSSVLFSVENSGSQLEPELLPVLFDRFKQGVAGTASRTGLGLGLTIAKGIVELHGGTIMAENTEMGARFVVRLPVLAYQDQPDSKRETVVDSTDDLSSELGPDLLSGLTIYVLEDEPEALEVLSSVLTTVGATVRAFGHPSELLAREDFDADALLSDLGLPGMDGLELMRTLRARGFTGPALALTAYASRRYQLSTLRAGFNLHIPKPIDREQLLIALGSLLGRFQDDD